MPRKRASAEAIDAYWNDVQGRVGYILALLDIARYGETLTLCATYLESVTQALVATNPRGGDPAADADQAEENDPYLSLIHPLQLSRVVTSLPGISRASATGFAVLFETADVQLLHRDQAVDIIRSTLPLSEAVLVERVLWKCTVAYVVFGFLRTQSYRAREGTQVIGLGSAFYEGESVHSLSVPELVALLWGMINEAHHRSMATGMLPESA